MTILLNILVVFALTLILTKSKVLAGKREFVEQRYEASKVGQQNPTWVHRIWHALMTCPMCSGFWVAIPICFFYPVYGLLVDILVVFSGNWLVHCLENCLFFSGEAMENLHDDLEDYTKNQKDFYSRLDRIQRKFENFLDDLKK